MKLFNYVVALMLIPLTLSSPAIKAQNKQVPQGNRHTMLAPGDLKWGDAPPGLPKGAKLAVLQGNPGGPGLFVVRLKFPAGYVIPPHWHPTDEYITVMSGTFKMGFGEKFDQTALKSIGAGGFTFTPMKTNHYAKVDQETIVQIGGSGPFEINYVNPSDDPRKTKVSSR